MSTHAREARSKRIIDRLDLGGLPLRLLECGHWQPEPAGGRARLAERAHCLKCAPKRTQRTQPPRGATNATKPGIESGRKDSRNGEAVRAVATNRANDKNGGRT